MRRRTGNIAMAIAAVAPVGAFAFALWPRHTPVSSAAADIDRPALAGTQRPTALVIGDAYTSGSGLAETSYGCMAAVKLGWQCELAAEPGTGYISGGTANRFPLDQGSGKSTSFGERIPLLRTEYQPDVVILDGGRDDLFAPPNTRFEVTASTLWQAHQTWPKARIVFVKPRFLNRPDDDLAVSGDIVNLLRQYSGIKDLVVVDPIAGFTGGDTKGLISGDGTNPNRKGEDALADALARELARNGIRPAS